ncbi:MAG: hypothetical protein QOK28_1385 [Actinomycetota bacterium]|jgi:hypothetical protein
MTHPPDEILSALLDHEAVDGADAAHVDGCAACQARAGALRNVAIALAESVAPAPPHVREAAVSAALVEMGGAGGAVRRLAMARRTRAKSAAGSARRMSAASAAAALLVALGVGGWLLSQAGGDADHRSNSLGVIGGTEAITTAALAAGQARAAAGYQAGELGEFDDIDDLAAVARQDLQRSDEVKSQHVAYASPCPLPPRSQQLWTAHLTFNGKDAAAWVRTTESGRRLEVLQLGSACAVVASRAI